MHAKTQPILLAHWNRVVTTRGDAVAVIDFAADSRHTFAQVENEAQQIESELRRALATSDNIDCTGQPVLLCLPNGARWLSAYLAIHRCGCVVAPVDPEPASANADAKLSALANQLQAVAKIDATTISAIQANAPIQTNAQSRSVAAQEYKGTTATDNTFAQPTRSSQNPTHSSRASTHLIKLTSGSTGQPQALPFTEANMIADSLNICATMGLHEDALNYAAIPFGHSYGLGNLVLPFLLQGTAIACASGILPRIIAREIAACGASFFPAVPTLARALCAAQVDPQQLASLRRVISAGSVLTPDIACSFESLYGKRIHNFYGSSETGGICFDASGEETLSGRSVGTALSNVSVDTDAQGRVRVRSAAVCASLADAEQRITLGDYGTLLPNGELRLEGRSGRQTKIGARRLDLSAWEAQARTVHGVEDAFACTAIRSNGETMLCAALQTQLPADTLREKLCETFPRWQQPARLITLTVFPQTARGKTDTTALRALLETQNA